MYGEGHDVSEIASEMRIDPKKKRFNMNLSFHVDSNAARQGPIA